MKLRRLKPCPFAEEWQLNMGVDSKWLRASPCSNVNLRMAGDVLWQSGNADRTTSTLVGVGSSRRNGPLVVVVRRRTFTDSRKGKES